MTFQIEFPEPEERKVVETELMRRVARRTMAVHRGGALVVWTGQSRNGKTWCGDWLVEKIEEAYLTNSNGFHAVHYEVGAIGTDWGGGDQKRAIRSLHHAAVGKISDAVYRQALPDDLSRATVHGLRAKNTQMVLVDEAGLLSPNALRGLVHTRDTAELLGWTLTLVLIGMDDLPDSLLKIDQVGNRVHEWCYFRPYDLAETHRLVSELHPHFATLDLDNTADRAQVEFVHDTYGGLPGLIAPFLRRLRAVERELGHVVTLSLLKAVHLRTQRDKDSAVSDAADRAPGSLDTGSPVRKSGRRPDAPSDTPRSSGPPDESTGTSQPTDGGKRTNGRKRVRKPPKPSSDE